MPNAPKTVVEATDLIKAAWNQYAASDSFGGMTYAQYQAKVQQSYATRSDIANAELMLKGLINDRDTADKITMATNLAVIKGIVGDPKYGDDSDLYEACGYIRKSERKSGLTRKHADSTPAAPASK